MVSITQINKLLVQKGIEKAKATHDDYNRFRYEHLKRKLTESEIRDLNLYLFGVSRIWTTWNELKELSF